MQKAFPNGKGLFDALNNKTLNTVKNTGLPFFHFTENEQQGSTFGARFTNAIQEVFSRGYDNIITIGNDTPQLKQSHLLKTAELLNRENFVLGSSEDGGFYLMGLKKSHFDLNSFLELPWNTSRLATAISLLVVSNPEVEIYKLQPLKDIDRLIDLKSLLNSFCSISKELKKIILLLLCSDKETFHISEFIRNDFFNEIYYNKGSPTLL